jgi:hypothetical protein
MCRSRSGWGVGVADASAYRGFRLSLRDEGEFVMALTSKDRTRVFERDQYRCGYCRLTVDAELPQHHPRYATVDHVVAVSKGGSDKPHNLVTACRRCNGEKANMDAEVYRWYRHMRQRGYAHDELMQAIEEVEADPIVQMDRQIEAWARAGLEYVKKQKAAGRKYRRLKPVALELEKVRRDPYEKVLGKAYKGTLMRAWLNGEV